MISTSCLPLDFLFSFYFLLILLAFVLHSIVLYALCRQSSQMEIGMILLYNEKCFRLMATCSTLE